VQIEASVAAEHGDALGQRFERFALHADERFVAAYKLQPLGHVVDQISDSAFRVRRGDHAQSAAIRQVPLMLARFEGAIRLVQLGFPFAEIGLFGKPTGCAQPIEHCRIRGTRIEKRRFEVEEHSVGGVVEGEPMIGGEDRNRG
jgi:hypothetical protein